MGTWQLNNNKSVVRHCSHFLSSARQVAMLQLWIILLLSASVKKSATDPITWKVCPTARTDVREGSSVSIRCEAQIEAEMPNANSYRWERQGSGKQHSFRRMPPTPKYWYVPASKLGDLHIRSVDRDDSGQEYLCLRGPHTANKLTRCNLATSLRVFWLNPDVVVHRLEPAPEVKPQIGSNVKLLCDVKSSEPPSVVKWFHNGELVRPTTRMSPEGVHLSIKSVNSEDSGIYHCYIEAVGGKIFTKSPLSLFFDDMATVFGPPVLYAKVSDDVVQPDLELKVTLPPKDRFTVNWYALKSMGQQFSKESIKSTDSSVTQNGYSLQFKGNSWQAYVTVLNLQPGSVSGRGHFFMAHVVDLQQKRMAYYVYEVVRPRIPTLDGNKHFEPPMPLDRSPQPVLVPRGRDFTQRVYLPLAGDDSADAAFGGGAEDADQVWAPAPTAVWTAPNGSVVPREGTVEAATSRLTVIRDYSLQLRDAQPSDSGYYHLVLSNPAGSVRNQLRLLVTSEPRLSQANRTVRADEDNEATLPCLMPGDAVSSSPATSFSWYRLTAAGKPVLVGTTDPGSLDNAAVGPSISLKSSSSHLLSIDPQVGHLTLRSLSPDAQGTYVCLVTTRMFEPGAYDDAQDRARNKSGYVDLRVVKRLRLCPKLGSTLFLEEGTQQVIDCQWYGEAQPTITWHRSSSDGTFAPLGSGELGVELLRNNTRLTLHIVGQDHHGHYRIMANSTIQGIAQRDFRIVVGKRPHVELLTTNLTVTPNSPVWLHCRATGSPTPKLTWTLKRPNGDTLIFYDLDSGVRIFGNGTLAIRRAGLDSVGEYQCTAANEYLMVHSPPLMLQLTGRSSTGDFGASAPVNRESMSRTIAIVVSCAVGYLGLIVILSVVCTLRMRRRRLKRREAEEAEAATAGGRLPLPLPHHQNQWHRQRQSPPQQTSPGGGIFQPVHQQQGRQDSCYESGTSRGSAMPPEYRSLLSQNSQGGAGSPRGGGGGPQASQDALELSQHHQHHQQPDGRSLNSGGSGGSYSYGRLHTNTPANSVAESTIDRLGRMYQIDRRRIVFRAGILGRSLFGQVRVGTFNSSPVLVKELSSTNLTMQSHFSEQVKMFSRCDHEHIAKLIGLSIDASPVDCPVMVLEYCENNNLFELLTAMRTRGQQLPENCQLRMCAQAAQAMEHLHSLGFVHGDIGCRNLMVTSDYSLKLTNMGPCLDRFSGQYAHCGPSQQLLAIRWMPPETLTHNQFGIKTDIWSYGVTVAEIYAMARQPMARLTDAELLAAAVASPDALWPEPLPEAVPLALAGLVDRCRSSAQDKRPTAAQIATQLVELAREAGL